jgi:hypothetical protein
MHDWIFDCFDWFDERFEPPDLPILPTKAYFSAPGGQSEATAELVLEDVKRHMNIDAPIEIAPLDVLAAEYRGDYQSMSQVSGTYQEIDGISLIRYDPEIMHRPIQFISLVAHELMHVRLSPFVSEVPGGEDAHELATDLGCIIAGFGVFQLQSADEAGWAGYMRQSSRAYAMAVFLERRGLSLEVVAPHLSTKCKKWIQRATKELT